MRQQELALSDVLLTSVVGIRDIIEIDDPYHTDNANTSLVSKAHTCGFGIAKNLWLGCSGEHLQATKQKNNGHGNLATCLQLEFVDHVNWEAEYRNIKNHVGYLITRKQAAERDAATFSCRHQSEIPERLDWLALE